MSPLRLKRVSDEDYIEQVRRSMKLCSRLRVWVLALSIAVLALVVSVGIGWFQFLWPLVPANAGGLVFLTGVLIGLGTGHALTSTIHGIFYFVFDFQRTERLLVQYHDLFAELRRLSTPREPIE
ncbi:MAG TPA: hypothetical protein VML55_17235 [Planctomycetaceae bacterium]|nr:hypothetical protein [Planctomycetaceae bacterium]